MVILRYSQLSSVCAGLAQGWGGRFGGIDFRRPGDKAAERRRSPRRSACFDLRHFFFRSTAWLARRARTQRDAGPNCGLPTAAQAGAGAI